VPAGRPGGSNAATLSAMSAEAAAKDVSQSGDAQNSKRVPVINQSSNGKQESRPKKRLRPRSGGVDAEIPEEVARVLTDIACNNDPVERLQSFMKRRSNIEYREWRNLVIMIPLLSVILGLVVAGFIVDGFSLSDLRSNWAGLLWAVTTAILVAVATYRYAFDHEMVRARLLDRLLRALSACVGLQKNPRDLQLTGMLARNLEAASTKFAFVYTRLPGHRARIYAAELKNRAQSGAQAIASMTSLLFGGPKALADLRDRLARAILRIHAEDWTAVAEIGTGESSKSRRSLRRLLEPATIPLLVGALTLITTVISLVSKAVE
jgi:hypothetical protein